MAIVQADLTRLPLAEGAFDLAFSIGVLHHGPDPRRAFAQVARRGQAGRPAGRLALPQEHAAAGVDQLGPPGRHDPAARRGSSNRSARAWACSASVPVLNRTLNKVANFSNHPDWTLRVCDNFDWYAAEVPVAPHGRGAETLVRRGGFDDLVELRPARSGRLYDWAYRHDLVIGSGVNVAGTRRVAAPMEE